MCGISLESGSKGPSKAIEWYKKKHKMIIFQSSKSLQVLMQAVRN